MPRINLEDTWFDDPRRTRLIEQIGEIQTDGLAVKLFRLAQTYFRSHKLIPEKIFKIVPHSHLWLDAGLAEITDEGVRISGQDEAFSWIKKLQVAGKKGGLSLSKPSKASRSKLKPQEPSSSSSSSSSASNNIKPSFDFDLVYKNYPNKKGKEPGFSRLPKLVYTQADFDALLLGVRNYALDQKRILKPGEFRPPPAHFTTFINQRRWLEWQTPPDQSPTLNLKLVEEG